MTHIIYLHHQLTRYHVTIYHRDIMSTNGHITMTLCSLYAHDTLLVIILDDDDDDRDDDDDDDDDETNKIRI